jgi:DAK2 domain fusion protein YloV
MRQPSMKVDPTLRERLASRYKSVDGRKLCELMKPALQWLRTNQQVVNSLNVFPVPDGDTGTNMVLTMQSACDEIAEFSDSSIDNVAHAIAQGALMGARGNSGVILSQILRGIARALNGKSVMDTECFVKALKEARDTAYKGVVRPVEGTILTVTKDIATAAETALQNGATSPLHILEAVVEEGEASLERTPDLLPVLKEAGVVDAGGKGLIILFEGILMSVYRQPLDQPQAIVKPLNTLAIEHVTEVIEPGQDWEVVVDFKPSEDLELKSFYGQLEEMGTSIQLGEGDGMYRMHIHVPDNTQYKPIEYIRSLGTVTKVAIENLMAQLEEKENAGFETLELASVQPGQIATVVVAPGKGIAKVFASLGAAAVIEGGQTMNPSTKEILAAFEDLPCDKVVILPNNKNVVLAAKQAIDLSVKNVAVVESVSVPQGIAAMLAINPTGELEETVGAMVNAMKDIHTGEITKATRSVEIDGVKVKEGQIIGLLNGHLAIAGDDLKSTLLGVLSKAEPEKSELITLYYGEDLSSDAAEQLAQQIRKKYSDQEVEVVEGGQPHYHIILSVE